MSIDAEPLSWDELHDQMTIDELRRFLRMGKRQTRAWAKEHGIYDKMTKQNVRISKQKLAEVLGREY